MKIQDLTRWLVRLGAVWLSFAQPSEVCLTATQSEKKTQHRQPYVQALKSTDGFVNIVLEKHKACRVVVYKHVKGARTQNGPGERR